MSDWWAPDVLSKFLEFNVQEQGAVGNHLGDGFRKFGLESPLEDSCDREWLQTFCDKPGTPLEHAALAIMLWGTMKPIDQGRFWNSRLDWLPMLKELRRDADLTRKQAYKAFQKANASGVLQGAGPAYFTKLIQFLLTRTSGFIMDQRLAQALETLAPGRRVVRWSTGDNNLQYAVRKDTLPDQNEMFCQMIEQLAHHIGLAPHALEARLFDVGARGPAGRGPWREYVESHWTRPVR